MTPEEILEIIKGMFLESKSAGYIALDALNDEEDVKAYVLCGLFTDYMIPEDVRDKAFDDFGLLYEPHRKPIEKKFPVKELIRLFQDKRSGKVGESAKQLKQRFMYLNYRDQLRIMELFLNSSKSYRRWCYKTLSKWREPKFDDAIVYNWRVYHEQNCLDVMVEQFPVEKMKEVYSEICEHLNPYLYNCLLQRFGKEDWVQIDKKWLKSTSPHPFYYIKSMSCTKEQLPVDECYDLFYNIIIDDFSLRNEDSIWEQNIIYVDEFGYTPPASYQFESIRIVMPNGKTIRIGDILTLFAKMGHFELVSGIINWGDNINKLLPNVEVKHINDVVESNKLVSKERFFNYIRLLRIKMPQKINDIMSLQEFDTNPLLNEMVAKSILKDSGLNTLIDDLGFDLEP